VTRTVHTGIARTGAPTIGRSRQRSFKATVAISVQTRGEYSRRARERRDESGSSEQPSPQLACEMQLPLWHRLYSEVATGFLHDAQSEPLPTIQEMKLSGFYFYFNNNLHGRCLDSCGLVVLGGVYMRPAKHSRARACHRTSGPRPVGRSQIRRNLGLACNLG